MKAIQLPTQEYLKECFEYEDGHLFWRERPLEHFDTYGIYQQVNKLCAGTIAGTKLNGYVCITLNRKQYKAHRIVYKMHTGEDPNIIDHVNRIKTDNRFENLRSGTHVDNMNNKGILKTNKSGHPNIHDTTKGWRVTDWLKGRTVHVGYYPTLEEAIQAKKEWDEA